MKLELVLDDAVAEAARRAAAARGKSLEEVVGSYLEELAGQARAETVVERVRALSPAGRSEAGWRFEREAIHDRPRADR